jgi:hypothetical protein
VVGKGLHFPYSNLFFHRNLTVGMTQAAYIWLQSLTTIYELAGTFHQLGVFQLLASDKISRLVSFQRLILVI